MGAKLGFITQETDDAKLIEKLLALMQTHKADFTNTFRSLSDETAPTSGLFIHEEGKAWHTQWKSRLKRQPQPLGDVIALMKSKNPVIIPRNHKVEQALAAATVNGDLSLFEKLLQALSHPYEDSPQYAEFHLPPKPEEEVHATFCGTWKLI